MRITAPREVVSRHPLNTSPIARAHPTFSMGMPYACKIHAPFGFQVSPNNHFLSHPIHRAIGGHSYLSVPAPGFSAKKLSIVLVINEYHVVYLKRMIRFLKSPLAVSFFSCKIAPYSSILFSSPDLLGDLFLFACMVRCPLVVVCCAGTFWCWCLAC